MRIWKPIETAPKDGTLILVKGNSGYMTHRTFIQTAYYDAAFRPLDPWIDVTTTCLSYCGYVPLYWTELTEEDLAL